MSLGRLWRSGARTLDQPTEERICRECHQVYECRFTPQTVCFACVAARRQREEEGHRERAMQQLVERREAAGLVGRLASMSWENWQGDLQPEADRSGRQFVREWPTIPSLALFGSPGCGKTHLCAAVTRAIVDAGYEARYVHVPTLTWTLRSATDWQQEATRHVTPLLTVPLVVLDDLGRQKDTEVWREALDVILDRRWLTGYATIIAANLTAAELETALGAAGASRFLSDALTVTFRPGDRRRQEVQG